jgi:hypothetical protein
MAPNGDCVYVTSGRLRDLGALLERQTFGERELGELATGIAGVLGTHSCAIVLLPEEKESCKDMVGVFPNEGWGLESTRTATARVYGEIARRVSAAGTPLSLPDVEGQLPPAMEWWPGGVAGVPLFIGGTAAGALLIPLGQGRRRLAARESELLAAIALSVEKSVEMARLRNLLQSKFAQVALAREGMFPPDLRHLETERFVKIFAKTFYREMTRAGFGPGHIIDAATEIISLLGEQVGRHSKRQSRHK